MCTSLAIDTLNDHVLAGRTMDFPVKADWKPVIISSATYRTPLAGTRKIKYPYLGGGRLIDNQDILVADGINTEGLSCSELMFPLKADYLNEPTADKLNLTPQDFLFWVLGEHKSIADVLGNLDNIAVIGREWLSGHEIYSFHWILEDPSGQVAIIEPLNKRLKVITDNIGVLTNSPTYESHVENLASKLNLAEINNHNLTSAATKLVAEHRVPEPTNTPTTRFVYAAITKYGNPKPVNAPEAFAQLSQTLAEVAIPFKPTMNDHPNFNFTHYISAWDCTSLTYQFTDCFTGKLTEYSLPEVLDQFANQDRFLV
ncbi:choloylglycine hydrolase [Lentilactobacillus curieae]|uniref:Choloylglycine hydrolase n=1 Tax=Lentilactobacillus curieae TaxID=1138822 RepID=A0A1S6QIH8_9LACO|nr:linear amide C-N hydrolase [Lentilactobacillus curieae]AQW21414.1 choloylglycine hydrolase [Lentilactobacillus curieae]